MLEDYPDVLEIRDSCERLHMSKKTAYQFVRDGNIPSRKIGRKYKISKKKVQQYIEEE